ncbi:MAG TPA: 2-oxoacid:acceptor oxidoreductase family protein [Nitrospiria bacterium]|nr:2-oxoacid:acceptor oxidoreductase family protein [Nitrospiria bacterium]
MFQIRIHGRGGQGVVTAAEILAVAAFLEGKYAQAFPSFGSERMGAPVTAFCRIADRAIRLREPVMEPDALIIQDPTLLHQVDLFAGIRPSGYILINSARTPEELGMDELISRLPAGHLRTAPASEIALEKTGRPLPNAALIGGLVALTGLLRSEAVGRAIRRKFPGKVGEANAEAAETTYQAVASGRPWPSREKSHAGTN